MSRSVALAGDSVGTGAAPYPGAMAQAVDHLELAGAFPAAGRQQWLDAVAKALDRSGGLDHDAALGRLRSTTYDGITIEPLYTATDAPRPDPSVRRGRGHHGWDVRQLVDADAGPGRAVSELERGASSILLDLSGLDELTGPGVAAALDGVLLDVATVVLHAGRRWREAADAFVPLLPSAGEVVHGLGADPLGEAAAVARCARRRRAPRRPRRVVRA